MPGHSERFSKTDEDSYTTSGTPFDVDSVMMFGPTEFGALDSRGARKTVLQSHQIIREIRCAIFIISCNYFSKWCFLYFCPIVMFFFIQELQQQNRTLAD